MVQCLSIYCYHCFSCTSDNTFYFTCSLSAFSVVACCSNISTILSFLTPVQQGDYFLIAYRVLWERICLLAADLSEGLAFPFLILQAAVMW